MFSNLFFELENVLMETQMKKIKNILFKVIEPKKKEFVIKSYADNFLKN